MSRAGSPTPAVGSRPFVLPVDEPSRVACRECLARNPPPRGRRFDSAASRQAIRGDVTQLEGARLVPDAELLNA